MDAILANSHPLMVEAFCLAAVPHWFDRPLLRAMREREDGREEGLIERLNRYSFVSPLSIREGDEPAYYVRSRERSTLQARWIAEDPEAYRTAHRCALAFREASPDPNPFAQAQARLYHQLFVDMNAGACELVRLFRTYENDRQLVAIDRLLLAVREAYGYLALLDGADVDAFGGLLLCLETRQNQLRGEWAENLDPLEELASNPGKRWSACAAQTLGYARAHEGQYVEAAEWFKAALKRFGQEANAYVDPVALETERAYTLIAVGDAYTGLAASVYGSADREAPGSGLRQRVQDLFHCVSSLPLVLYLSPYLGLSVWHPRFWSVLRDLDWIVARLFVSAARHYRRADRMLEAYGTPAEGVIADERLAFLYLALGDARYASQRFQRLLSGTWVPLGVYRRALASAGLGETQLQLNQPARAQASLRDALPVLDTFQDRGQEAHARQLLAEALLAQGDETAAIESFASSLQWYEAQGQWAEATRIAERLEEWQPRIQAPAVQEQAKDLADRLPQRQYSGSYQHPLPIRFRRAVALLLPVFLVLAQLRVIQVDNVSGLAPQARFRPAPLLDPAQTVILDLSLGVTSARVNVLAAASVLLRGAAILIAGYLIISLALGLAMIALTRLRTVQARGRGATVRLDEQGMTLGEGDAAQRLRWGAVSRFVKADVCLWSQPSRDNSAIGLATAEGQRVISGSTNRYASVRRRIAARVPDTAHVVDLDHAILRSIPGALFALSLVLIVVLDLLAKLAPPDWLFRDVPGVLLSVVDVYPYLLLGLILPPLWWGVVQPLRQRVYLWPRSQLIPWMLGLGLLLALAQVLIRFRPLLTVLNLYPPLTTIVVLVGAGLALWRAEEAGLKVYPTHVRVIAAVVVVLGCALMGTVLWRDTGAYHLLLRADGLRDQALKLEDSDRAEAMLADAVSKYGRAADMGSGAIWGLDTKRASSVPVGFPAPDSLTWLSALTSQAALQTQLGDPLDAIQAYAVALSYTGRPDRVYAWRGLARQIAATTPAEHGGVETDQDSYEGAMRDLDAAIDINPNNASYHLWRAVALQALGRLDEAFGSYDDALLPDRASATRLKPAQQERALTGQGWIRYTDERYTEALDLFRQAREANPASPSAWLGEGYALYSLGLYEEALPVWERAAELDPRDPSTLISLGTLHWKFGKIAEADTKHSGCDEYATAVDLFTQALDRDNLQPQLDVDVAYTYRTRAQVLWLLKSCPGYDRVETLRRSVEDYGMALDLDPQNATFRHMHGRLSLVVWLGQPDRTSADVRDWLLSGLDDMERALALDPVDNSSTDYVPNWFLETQYAGEMFDAALIVLQDGYVPEAVRCYSWDLDREADTVDAAIRIALLAMIDEDIPEAAQWFNEAIRRISIDNSQYYTRLKASRDHLRALWAIDGVNGDEILAEMEAQLPRQLRAHPELRADGWYWRYRAWFKAHIGHSAFMLGAEDAADALLQSAGSDAVRAYRISTDHAYVYTYLPEGAWGWYHLERGQDYEGQDDLEAALADYEAAFAAIVPVRNGTAQAEKTVAAFSAGLAAFRLDQPYRAETWYADGIATVKAYAGNSESKTALEGAIAALQELLKESPALAPVAQPILDEMEARR